MTTPDTEVELRKEIREMFKDYLAKHDESYDISFVPDVLTNKVISSRDTYWKERVRDIRFMDLPEIVLTKEECKKRGIETEWDFTVFVKRGDVDTLLDNLK